MIAYPLSISSKGQNKRKVSIADPANMLAAYGEVNIAQAHRKTTTLYADKKKQQPIAVLSPSMEKRTVTFNMQGPGGEALGTLVVQGGFTMRDFEMFDAMGNSVARISGEGVGREMAGMVVGGLAGAAIGGRASYQVTMQSGASVEITRRGRREATVEKTGGDLTPAQEQLLLPSLIVWAAYALS